LRSIAVAAADVGSFDVVEFRSMPDTVSCPHADAPLQDLLEFALSYDGYQRLAADAEALSRVVEPVLRELETGDTLPDWVGLDLLRGTLFFIQRQTHHWGDVPPEQERHMRRLVAAIGQHPLARELPTDWTN
jgi:hypothetical protein